MTLDQIQCHKYVDILDIQQEQGTLFDLVRKAEFYILAGIRRRVEFDGSIERIEIPELPMEAVREALINAFTHRSYRSNLAVQVEIYPDTVEIFSPGWFPEGHTPEAHLSGDDKSSVSPNQLIANTLFKSKDIESFATGMPRIQELCDAEGVSLRYENALHGTIVIFERKDPFADVPASSSKGPDEASNGEQNPPESAQIRLNPPASSSNVQEVPGNCNELKNAINSLSKNERTIYDYLYVNHEAGITAISDGTGIPRRTSSDILRRLRQKGLYPSMAAVVLQLIVWKNNS